MQKRLMIFLLALITALSLHAQLPRRAFLGTQLQQVNDSIAQFHKLKQPKGVLVLMVVARSSAEAMGIEANDLVINVENKEVNSPAELINAIGKYRSGDEIAITIMRDGESLNKSGILKPLPHETSDHADVIYDEVPFDGGHIRTIIHKPRVNGKVPAVFFIQGYTCTSIDRIQADHPYKKLLDGLVEQGFAIVKTEKAGIGDSQNDRSCAESSLFEEIDLFSASYNNLKKYDFIDQDNIFIFGHSMGGIAAPLLKTDFAPKGIAVYGTVIRPWFEYFLEHSRIQKFIMGWDYLENEQQHEAALKFFYRLMVEKQSPAQLVQDPSVKEFMEQRWSYDGSEMLLGRHYTFWQQLQETKLFNAWAHTPAHVLSIWGEGDFVAFNPYEHQLIADVVNRYNPGKAKYLSFPNIDHSFIRVENQQHAVKVRNDWEYNAQNFNYDIVIVLSQWMNDVQSTSETP